MTITIAADATVSVTTYSEYKVDDVITLVQANLGGTVTTATALTHILAGQMDVLRGLDTRANPPRIHLWSFLQPTTTMTFSATTTGTASGLGTYSATTEHTTLTATTAIFDDSMIGHSVTFDTSEEAYEIVSLTSTSIAVLEGDASAEKSGDTLTIDCKGYHATPTGFRGIRVPPVWAYSASGNRYRMERRSPADIRAMWRDSSAANYTNYWALESTGIDTTDIQGYRFLVAPVPIEDMVATIQMFVRIPDPAASRYFPGGHLVSMAIRDAALANVELISGGTQGVFAARAQASLWAAIDADKETIASVTSPERLRRA